MWYKKWAALNQELWTLLASISLKSHFKFCEYSNLLKAEGIIWIPPLNQLFGLLRDQQLTFMEWKVLLNQHSESFNAWIKTKKFRIRYVSYYICSLDFNFIFCNYSRMATSNGTDSERKRIQPFNRNWKS